MKTGEERIVGICRLLGGKNLDLIASTSVRYLRYARKWSWAGSNDTNGRGVVGSASLPRVLSLVEVVTLSFPEKSVCFCLFILYQAFSSPRVSVFSIFVTIKGSFEFKIMIKIVKREKVV